MKRSDIVRCGLLPGALAGLVGGLVFGAAMTQLGLLPTIASLARAESDAVGLIVHLIGATIIGAGFGLLLVELPQGLVVAARHRTQRGPIEISQQVEPEYVLLGFEVQVVRFDDMDQGDLDVPVAGKYHAVGPLGVVFVDAFHLPQTRCVVKTKGHTEDHFSLLPLATSNGNCAKSHPQRSRGEMENRKTPQSHRP